MVRNCCTGVESRVIARDVHILSSISVHSRATIFAFTGSHGRGRSVVDNVL